jgi:hypothetical protein
MAAPPPRFFDEDITIAYDREISQFRKEIYKECDPCLRAAKYDSIIEDLQEKRSTYWPRPCNEGWCFSIWIPHRDRLKYRIRKLLNSADLEHQACLEQK